MGLFDPRFGQCGCGEFEPLLFQDPEPIAFLCCECRADRVARIIAARRPPSRLRELELVLE